MNTRVKIYGAGSIGNHLSNAARALGWDVDLCDIDPAALERARTDIYPTRYGKWDDGVSLYLNEDAPKTGHDYIFIGTPPDHHMSIALESVKEGPKAILVEKPLCGPDLKDGQKLLDAAKENNVKVFVGYDHVVGLASDKVESQLSSMDIGVVETLDVEFREHWGGIFAAHHWLDGPQDSYLGYWKRGGGASSEHSHALNLWQHFASLTNLGTIVEVNATIDYVDDGNICYDKLFMLNLLTDKGVVGRVIQDVVTNPPRKWSRIQGSNGSIDWQCGVRAGVDKVSWNQSGGQSGELEFTKTRPDDFIKELKHLEVTMRGDIANSPISLECGLDTMLVVAAAHKSAQEKRTVIIDRSKGYTLAALK